MITLRPVPHFGSFPDGRLRAGPFKTRNIADLQHLLTCADAHPSRDEDDKQLVSITSQGMFLSAGGPGVAGYFLSGDGFEIENEDLEALLLEAVAPGVPFRITGHYCPDEGSMIVTEASYVHDGLRITSRVTQRHIQKADGSIQILGGARATVALRLVS